MRPPYGANCLVTIGGVSYAVIETSDSSGGAWVEVLNGPVGLRCWWADPLTCRDDIYAKSFTNRVYIVLPEVFGVNAWVRSVADRLAAQGYPALAVPLFSRTAPDLELAYDSSDLAEGCRHKDVSTSEQILADVAAAISWLRARYPHAPFLAATLPRVEHAFDFYGAGVGRMRLGGGEPSLSLLPNIETWLTCVFGTADPFNSC